MKPLISWLKEKIDSLRWDCAYFQCKYFFGHKLQIIGGRGCPRINNEDEYYYNSEFCSQPVFRCERCRLIDYGESGGPGWKYCQEKCGYDPDCKTAGFDNTDR